MESTRILNSSKLQPFGHKATADGIYADDELLSGREMFVDELNEAFPVPLYLNGKLVSKDATDQPADVSPHKTLVSLFHPQPSEGDGESADKGKPVLQQQVKGYEWIEMGVRRQVVGARADEAEKKTESATTKDPGGVFRNNRMQSGPADKFRSFAASPLRPGTAGPPVLLVGEYPAVDYPINEDSDSKSATSELPSVAEERLSAKRDSEHQPGSQDTWRSPKQPGDAETWNFSSNLKSPGLRKRRPNGNSHSPYNQTLRPHLDGPFSKSLSDYSQNNKRNSVPYEVTRTTHERIPRGPQTLSEPELPELNFSAKNLQGKTQRSASIPNIPMRHELGPSSSVHTLPQCRVNSPLEGLLERAKERVKERHAVQNDRNRKVADLRTRYPPLSPSFSTSHSASFSDGDRELEEEVEVELTRYRALTVSDGWKEQLVDGDEDYRRDRWV